MNIVFVGNYQKGYVGEISDEAHLARELESLGHKVHRVPRDIWKAHCDGLQDPNWTEALTFPPHIDFCIITKWNHFNDGKYVKTLKKETIAPVAYWTWDFMDWPITGHWHKSMAQAADIHLTNEGGLLHHMWKEKINAYYFPFDVADGTLNNVFYPDKEYDVVFFGSYIQKGDRAVWIKEINKTHKVKVFSWNWKEWINQGFTDAEPPVYENDFAQKVAHCKIILGFNVSDHCWGYWSNRTGKILTLGGFLLQRYVPGMELFLRDGCEYFSTINEANEKIDHYLAHDDERQKVQDRALHIGKERFTSKARIKDLIILLERFLKGGVKSVDR